MLKKLRAFTQLLRSGEYFGNNISLAVLGGLLNQSQLGLFSLLHIFAVNTLTCAFAFAINDIEDAEDDAKDPAKVNRNPISAKRLKTGEARVLTAALAGLCLLIAWPLGRGTFLATTLGLVLGFLYSYKPIRLKSMPVVDLVSHGIFLGSIQTLNAALAYNSPLTQLAVLATGAVFATSLIGDLKNEIRDWKVDRHTHIHNTASIINVRVVGPYLEYLYIFPIIALVLVLAYVIPMERRLLTMAGAIILGVLYLLLPKKIRNPIANRYSQQMIFVLTILAYVYFYLL